MFVDSGLIVIATFISLYEKSRNFVKNLVGKDNYIEVFIDCPLDVCIKKDPKRLYEKALKNEKKNLTGISSVYEKPKNPDIRIESCNIYPEGAVKQIIRYLERKGYIRIEKKN